MKTSTTIIILYTLTLISCGISTGELTRAEAERITATEWKKKLTRIEADHGTMWDAQVLTLRDLRMPLHTAIYGTEPADGRSLYISMHGGGAAPAATNDEQWENQKTLYEPPEGVYVAPRAAVDDWNMWFRPFLDTLFPVIIRTAMVRHNVNPDKVYLMGYSAGGDGAYRMAPRLADRWAATAMMAGTRGEASPLNLRNVGFTMWMGELDNAFDRNTRVREFNRLLDSLHADDPAGYPHSLNIVPGRGHWMENADTLAVDWMRQYRRNPYPDRVVWRQEESARSRHLYWLSIPAAATSPGITSIVSRQGNTFTIERNDQPTLYIDLNDSMVDLDRPIVVVRDDRPLFNEKTPRRAGFILSSIEDRGDPDYIFSARIEVDSAGVRSSPLPTCR